MQPQQWAIEAADAALYAASTAAATLWSSMGSCRFTDGAIAIAS